MVLTLRHLISLVAFAALVAVAFGTFGVWSFHELERQRAWREQREELFRAVPDYPGQREELVQ